MSKFLDEKGLQYFWTKIKTLMSSAIDTATNKFLPLEGGTMSGDIVYQSSKGRNSMANTINVDGVEVSLGGPGGSSTSTLTYEGLNIGKNGGADTTTISAASVTTPKIIKTGATSDDILLGDGSTKNIDELLPQTNPHVSGTLWIDAIDSDGGADINGINGITTCNKGDDFTAWNTNGGTTKLPEYSDGTLSVKQLQGKALDGKSNKTLVLGFDANSKYPSGNTIGTHNVILIGAGEEGVTDSTQQDDIYILSPSNIDMATKNGSVKMNSGSAVQINGKQAVNVISEGDMDIKATRAVTMDGATGNLTLGDDFTRLSAADGKAFVRLGDNGSAKVHVVGSKMYFNDDTTNPETNAWINASGNKVKINTKDGSGMIQTNATEGSEEVKFRAGSANTMRLNAPEKDASGNVTTPGGLRVFANLFALAEMATDLPTTLSETAKTTLNTKSVQSILGDMLDNGVKLQDDYVKTNGRIYLVTKNFAESEPGVTSAGHYILLDPQGFEIGDSDYRMAFDTDTGFCIMDNGNNTMFGVDFSSPVPAMYWQAPTGDKYYFNFSKAQELGLVTKS